MTVTVAVDAGGADLGAAEVARGAGMAASRGRLRVLLFGDVTGVEAPPDVELIHAPVSVAKAPDPAAAVRRQPDASVVQAVQAVADGRADAVVSGGSTGAALAAALFRIKRARGVHRPALAVVVPVPGRPFLLLDAGANVTVRSEHLVQFAHMGGAYAEAVLGTARPRVALLSNGAEPTKGGDLVRDAHAGLHGTPGFVGNVEGFAVATGEADVVVTDGFTGNVFLKTMEGTSKALLEAVRTAATSSARAKLGGLLLKPSLGGLRSAVDPEEQGGAVLLGLRRVAVVPHGSFGARGFARAIELGARAAREDVARHTHARLERAGALRRPAPVQSASAATVPDQP
jgi:phosphate acyltransferase